MIPFGNEQLIVEILRGNYQGVQYRYDKVSVDEQPGLPKLNFHYTIIQHYKFTEEDLTYSSEFIYYIGDILVDIITNYKVDNAPRTHDYQEPDA